MSMRSLFALPSFYVPSSTSPWCNQTRMTRSWPADVALSLAATGLPVPAGCARLTVPAGLNTATRTWSRSSRLLDRCGRATAGLMRCSTCRHWRRDVGWNSRGCCSPAMTNAVAGYDPQLFGPLSRCSPGRVSTRYSTARSTHRSARFQRAARQQWRARQGSCVTHGTTSTR